MSKQSLVVPVRYREHNGVRYEIRVGTTEAELTSVSSDEAPVAVRWVENRYQRIRVREYRAFGDRLYTPVLDHDAPYPSILLRGITRGSARIIVSEHPFRYREPWSENQASSDEYMSHGAHDNQAFREMERRVLDRAATALVIQGKLYMPSVGPVLAFNARANQLPRHPMLEHRHGEALEASFVEDLAFRFSAMDGTVEETMARHFHGMRRVVDLRPEVLSREGYSIDMSPVIAEATAWHMLWHTREMTMEEAGRDIVEANMGLRQVLAERWPNVSPDRRVAHPGWAYPHRNGESIPPPGDLLPAIRKMYDATVGRVPYGTTAAWGMSIDRAGHDPVPVDDMDTMARMRF